MWLDDMGTDWHLLAFVKYEGINTSLVRDIEPIVLAKKCVDLFGGRWCMLPAGTAWHVGVHHESWPAPVNVSVFNPRKIKRSLPRLWQRRLLQLDVVE